MLPLQATQAPATQPSAAALAARPASALAPPPSGALAGVTGVVSAVAGNPDVPVTLQASGQALGLLADGFHQNTLTQLGALAATPAAHEFTSATFVPVDATSLVAGGVSSELSAQIARGAQALGSVPHAPGVQLPTSPGAGAGIGAYVTNDDLDEATAAALAADGYTRLVLPADSATSPPANGSAAEPFTVGSGRTSMTAIASDADLASRFAGAPGDPVLAANQLASELAQLYYEQPNALTPRGVVVVAPNARGATTAPS